MGVDRLKLPERDKWLDGLLADHEKPDRERDRFYLVWIFRGRRVGHSSINKIVIGTEAFIHLHLCILPSCALEGRILGVPPFKSIPS
jgi:hypothetical protein